MAWSEGDEGGFIPDNQFEEYHKDIPPTFRKHITEAIKAHKEKLDELVYEEYPEPPKYEELYKHTGSCLIDTVRRKENYQLIHKIFHNSNYLNSDEYDITESQVEEYMGLKILDNGLN